MAEVKLSTPAMPDIRTPRLRVSGLTKKYYRFAVFSGVSFSLPR